MKIMSQILNKCRQINWLTQQVDLLQTRLERVQRSLGRLESRQLSFSSLDAWKAHDFPVFSQCGEDGLIQFLISNLDIPRKIFVEFGAQMYQETNTRFLVQNDYWSGLLIEGNPDWVEVIKKDPIYWQYNLKAVQSFVTRENINGLIAGNGISGDIGLLSIDIDGNDYWVWEAITGIHPAIVIVEYNFRFGSERKVVVAYRPDFERGKAHSSMIYYGASLAALTHLANKKGYALVGCTQMGNDAFFVRRDLLKSPIVEKTVAEAYVAGPFRETRAPNGDLLFLSTEQEQAILKDLPVIQID